MFVVRQKPHNRFKRRGPDLIIEAELSLEEALTGGKFTFEHLGGKKINLTLEPGRVVKPDDVLVVEGMGMPDFRAPGKIGKLYFIVKVKFPDHVPEENRDKIIEVLRFLCIMNSDSV